MGCTRIYTTLFLYAEYVASQYAHDFTSFAKQWPSSEHKVLCVGNVDDKRTNPSNGEEETPKGALSNGIHQYQIGQDTE